MLNVLKEALIAIDRVLIKSQRVSVITRLIENVNGFPITTESQVNIIAHIQPLTPFEITKLGDSTLGSKSVFCFWIVKGVAEATNYLNNKNCEILWGTRRFSIYSKDDWAQNGWIKVIAYERNPLPEPEPEFEPETELENV